MFKATKYFNNYDLIFLICKNVYLDPSTFLEVPSLSYNSNHKLSRCSKYTSIIHIPAEVVGVVKFVGVVEFAGISVVSK